MGTTNQKRPELNEEIFKLYCSGMTIRRMAKVLGCSTQTVLDKIIFLSDKARKYHEEYLAYGLIQTNEVSFDEMESFEHTKLKPLSIAIAVCVESGRVIDLQVATMNAKGHIASRSQQLYGWRKDTRADACEEVICSIKKCCPPNVKVVSDGKLHYLTLLKTYLPNCNHVPIKARLVKKAPKEDKKAIQILNHRCALLRADISRLGRKTWATTKNKSMLQRHLDLLICYINNYKFSDVINEISPVKMVA